MKAEELGKLIIENSKCKMCGDDMAPAVTPIPGYTFESLTDFNKSGIGFICNSCGSYYFISAQEVESKND